VLAAQCVGSPSARHRPPTAQAAAARSIRLARQGTQGIATPPKEIFTKKAIKPTIPKGSNEKKVRALAEYYDNQTDEEGAAEIENAEEIPGETWLPVPKELVPAVKKMIARHRKTRVKC
jgi:hypothetical protein